MVQAELNDLRETHERLQIDSAAEIRKLIREAREATRTARSEASAAAEEADQVLHRVPFFFV